MAGESEPRSLDPRRAGLYRIVFALAAGYNLGFGLWAALWPQAFFALFQMAAPRYPAVWQCLGMVIGLYGLAYAYAARRLPLARPFIAIGLLGKILGPIGWLLTVQSGQWPLRTFTLIVFNDIIWWLPFSLFLLEGTRLGRRLRGAAPYVCAAVNGLAGLALLLALRPGTEVTPDAAERARYIGQNLAAWRGGWALWMAAALSLVTFIAWWGARLPARGWALTAFLVAVAGLGCDLLAESLYIGWLPAHLEQLQRPASLLTGGAANGLYTAAGILLTLTDRSLAGRLRALAWGVWLSGILLSATTVAAFVPGMVASGAALMTLFVPWSALMGWKRR
ncbi:MAG: hypothetical protein ACRDHL_11225 [Candidatus Promineifilaceae bacterium]